MVLNMMMIIYFLSGGDVLQDSSNNQNSYRNSEKKKMRVNIKESLLTIDKEKVESLTEDLEIHHP